LAEDADPRRSGGAEAGASGRHSRTTDTELGEEGLRLVLLGGDAEETLGLRLEGRATSGVAPPA
jgi:hypothetical protein